MLVVIGSAEIPATKIITNHQHGPPDGGRLCARAVFIIGLPTNMALQTECLSQFFGRLTA